MEKAMAPHSSTLAWRIPWTEEPGGLQSMGSLNSQTRLNDFTFTFHFHALEKEMATHSSVLAWRIPGTGEPGGLPLWGRTESDTTEVTQQQQHADLQDLLELTPPKDVLFIIGDWNAKAGSQETPGVTGNFVLWRTKRSRSKANSFAKRTHWSQQTPSSYNTRGDSTHGHHQMVNTEIRLIIFFAAIEWRSSLS